MRIMIRLWLLLITFTIFLGASRMNGVAASPENAIQDQKATVYVYSEVLADFAFYCDDQGVAVISQSTYLGLKLDPGPHVFRIGEKKPGLELTLVGNQTYYLSCVYGLASRLKLTVRDRDRGEREIRALWPLPADKIKDLTRAVIIDTSLNHPTVENWKVTLVSAQRLERLELISIGNTGERKAGKNKHFLRIALKIEYIGNATKVANPMVSIIETGRADKPKIHQPKITVIEGERGEASGNFRQVGNLADFDARYREFLKAKVAGNVNLNQVVDFFFGSYRNTNLSMREASFKIEGILSRSSAILKRGTDFGTIYFIFELPNILSEPRLYFLGGSTPIVLEYKEAI